MRELGCYKNTEDFLLYAEDDLNATCPVLFKDFQRGPFTMNKSYLIHAEDVLAASRVKKSNSISMINALKFRWEVCLPRGDKSKKWDLKRVKTPLREFVKEFGLELYLDMDEVIDVRIPLK